MEKRKLLITIDKDLYDYLVERSLIKSKIINEVLRKYVDDKRLSNPS